MVITEPVQKVKSKSLGYKPIGDYGIIGDLNTIALVWIDGSIDWCCLPHFDSPSIFGRILDVKKGGYFQISTIQKSEHKQMYLPDTCVLVTRFLNPEGVGEVIDFMPIVDDKSEDTHCHQIIRKVKAVRRKVNFRLECHPAFKYALDSKL